MNFKLILYDKFLYLKTSGLIYLFFSFEKLNEFYQKLKNCSEIFTKPKIIQKKKGFGFFFKKKKLDSFEIGSPKDFKQNYHVGYDAFTNAFSSSINLPDFSVSDSDVDFHVDMMLEDEKGNDDSLHNEFFVHDCSDEFDVFKICSLFDKNINRFCDDCILHSSIIKLDSIWEDKTCFGFNEYQQTDEMNKTIDLLDALSFSGIFPFDNVSFHILLSGNHDFKRSVIDTIIQENINPVSSLLHSNTIIASTIFGVQNPASLLNTEE